MTMRQNLMETVVEGMLQGAILTLFAACVLPSVLMTVRNTASVSVRHYLPEWDGSAKSLTSRE
jgi:hypothetical protein